MERAFDAFDLDKDGLLMRHELKHFVRFCLTPFNTVDYVATLESDFSHTDWQKKKEQFLDSFDHNGDGRVGKYEVVVFEGFADKKLVATSMLRYAEQVFTEAYVHEHSIKDHSMNR